MNTSKMKVTLVTACCFVVALCSDIRCMDTKSDIQEPTSYKNQNNSSGNYLDSLKPEIDNSLQDSMLPLNQDENESSSTSWMSYVSSPVKVVVNGTYNIVDFAVKHPTQATITALIIGTQFTALAAEYCNCIWTCRETTGPGLVGSRLRTLGPFENDTACMDMGTSMWSCSYQSCNRWPA